MGGAMVGPSSSLHEVAAASVHRYEARERTEASSPVGSRSGGVATTVILVRHAAMACGSRVCWPVAECLLNEKGGSRPGCRTTAPAAAGRGSLRSPRRRAQETAVAPDSAPGTRAADSTRVRRNRLRRLERSAQFSATTRPIAIGTAGMRNGGWRPALAANDSRGSSARVARGRGTSPVRHRSHHRRRKSCRHHPGRRSRCRLAFAPIFPHALTSSRPPVPSIISALGEPAYCV